MRDGIHRMEMMNDLDDGRMNGFEGNGNGDE